MKLHPHLRSKPGHSNEAGYFLIVMMLFLTLIAIGLTAVAPAFVQQMRRQREEELIHRGKAYVRAIRLYYRRFGRYPVSIDQLENTNNVRFLRKRFKDPMTADGNWRLIHFGEAQLTLPNAGPVMPGATPVGGASPGGFGQSPGQTIFGPTGSTQASSGQPASGQTGSESSSSQPGTPAAQMGTLQSGGPTFGGGPIVGVSSQSKKESIKELNSKNHYNDWEFVYDPRLDIGMGALLPGQGTPLQPGAPGVPLAPGTNPTPGIGPSPGMGPGPGMNPGPQPPPSPGR